MLCLLNKQDPGVFNKVVLSHSRLNEFLVCACKSQNGLVLVKTLRLVKAVAFSGGRKELRQVVLRLLKDCKQFKDVLLLLQALLVTLQRDESGVPASDRVWIHGIEDGVVEHVGCTDDMLDTEGVKSVANVFEQFSLKSTANAKSWAICFCKFVRNIFHFVLLYKT